MKQQDRNDCIVRDILVERLSSKVVAEKYGLSRYRVREIVRERHANYKEMLYATEKPTITIDSNSVFAQYQEYYKEKLHLSPYEVCKLVGRKFHIKTDSVIAIVEGHVNEVESDPEQHMGSGNLGDVR